MGLKQIEKNKAMPWKHYCGSLEELRTIFNFCGNWDVVVMCTQSIRFFERGLFNACIEIMSKHNTY